MNEESENAPVQGSNKTKCSRCVHQRSHVNHLSLWCVRWHTGAKSLGQFSHNGLSGPYGKCCMAMLLICRHQGCTVCSVKYYRIMLLDQIVLNEYFYGVLLKM